VVPAVNVIKSTDATGAGAGVDFLHEVAKSSKHAEAKNSFFIFV